MRKKEMVCGKRAGFVSVNRAQARMMSLQLQTITGSRARFSCPDGGSACTQTPLHPCGMDARLGNVSPDPYASTVCNIIITRSSTNKPRINRETRSRPVWLVPRTTVCACNRRCARRIGAVSCTADHATGQLITYHVIRHSVSSVTRGRSKRRARRPSSPAVDESAARGREENSTTRTSPRRRRQVRVRAEPSCACN